MIGWQQTGIEESRGETLMERLAASCLRVCTMRSI
jgi:hypothetical protein